VPVHCAALPAALLESELFGHERGSFTGATERREGRFESADGGTIFLDEIGEIGPEIQVKLLRFIETKSFERIGSSENITVDARVVAATHRNLQAEVTAGRFREDLYWRLNVVPIVIPPLRARSGDIALLLDHYVQKFNRLHDRRVRFSDEAVEILRGYHWPGNVRELANLAEHLVIMAEKPVIAEVDLPPQVLAKTTPVQALVMDKCMTTKLPHQIEHLEREQIIRALKESNGVQQKASRALGMTPRQLGYRIRKYRLDVKDL
jgi:Nif-specific regulatory protein